MMIINQNMSTWVPYWSLCPESSAIYPNRNAYIFNSGAAGCIESEGFENDKSYAENQCDVVIYESKYYRSYIIARCSNCITTAKLISEYRNIPIIII